jgi:LysM repeat protein
MNKSNYLRWGLILGLVGLIIACVLVLGLAYSSGRARAFNSRPLVLIHSPVNHGQVTAGQGIIVHATARSDNGLTHMELWAGDALVTVEAAPNGSAPANLTLSATWVPQFPGSQALIVRAYSADGTDGQTMVMVTVTESGESETGSYVVQEGDTLTSIAEEHSTTPEDLVDLNPGLDPGGPAPGDALSVPDSEPPSEEVPTPPEDGDEAPPLEGDPPGSTSVFELLFGLGPLELFGEEAESLTLRLEIPTLHTGEAYDGLHCYIGLAGGASQWYPDADNDQSTDESFASLGSGSWDSATYLDGEAAPVITWPSDQPLPLNVSCVGITAGGTDALELGRIELSIPPEDWDGVIHDVEVAGDEGSYEFGYRVTRSDGAPRTVPLYLDPDMSPPFDAHLDDRRISLRWDYEPRADEEPIDGFRVYLNGNLQWVEPPDSRESGLPYEWFNPPCGTTYTFAVTAFRLGFPDGPESLPSIAILNQPEENCTREIQITFLTLETFDLGGDGRYEDRHGDVGPAYGHFFANEKQITFSGGDLGPGLDMPSGLSHNTVYDLAEMSADPGWRFSGMNSTIVDVPENGTFEFGFTVMDQDSGRCNHSDDPGCDDLICGGRSVIYENSVSGEFDRLHEGAISSENGRCRMTFQWGPAFGSPVGSGEAGGEPLPWINVEELSIEEATGLVRIHVRNTGTATWPWRDLNVELQTREGDSLGVFTWPGFVLETGQRTVLENPEMRVDAPYDACIFIDPFNEVLEKYERSGAMIHSPVCPKLPDLIVSDVSFDPAGGGRLRVAVQNLGDAALENRTIAFRSTLADGSSAYLNGSWPGVSLEPGAMRVFDLIGVTETVRDLLANGYSVTVNPEGTVAELDLDNNIYTVRGTSQMQIYWCETIVPHYYGWGHTVRMDMTVDAVSGSSTRRLLTQHVEDYFSYIYIDDYDIHYVVGDAYPGRNCTSIGGFEVRGDEQLQVTISGQYQAGSSGSWDDLGAGTSTFHPQNDWGGEVSIACSGYDYNIFDADRGWHDFVVYPDLGMLAPPPWTALYHLCVERPEEP